MRVLYDGAAFQNGHQRGVQRVFRETIRRLPPDIDPVLMLTGTPRSPLPERARVVRAALPGRGLLTRGARDAAQAWLSTAILARTAGAIDVFHSTYFTLPPRPMRSVVHVHDMIVERFVDLFQGRWAEEEVERKRRTIERADWIIAVSNATASEVARFYPSVQGRITTVHLAAGHLAGSGGVRVPAGPARALFVGDRGQHKNFMAVLDALESPRWPRDVGLTVVGAAWKANEALRVERLAGRGVVGHVGRVSDEELAGLYRGAACAIVPSIAEGFGLPLLEAQSCGAPLVCSDIEVFREVAGTGALYFDPHRPDELAERVAAACDPGTRERLCSDARANQGRFSWEKSAELTAEVYRRVCATGPGAG